MHPEVIHAPKHSFVAGHFGDGAHKRIIQAALMLAQGFVDGSDGLASKAKQVQLDLERLGIHGCMVGCCEQHDNQEQGRLSHHKWKPTGSEETAVAWLVEFGNVNSHAHQVLSQ